MQKDDYSEAVLRYNPHPVSRATVRRHYAAWRKERGMPPRCDLEECHFHKNALVWQGKVLALILDHINGNKLDNRPNNLRYLCPNCDSQLSTRGGKNIGRVFEVKDGSYILLSRDNRRHYYLIAEKATLKKSCSGTAITVRSG